MIRTKYLFLTFLSALAITGCYEPEGYDDDVSDNDDSGGETGGTIDEAYYRQFTYRTEGASHTYLRSDWAEGPDHKLLLRAHVFLHPDGRFDLKLEEALGSAEGNSAAFRDAIESRPFSGMWKVNGEELMLGDIGIGKSFKVDGRPGIKLTIKRQLHEHPQRRTLNATLELEKGQFPQGMDSLTRNIYASDAMSWLHGSSFVGKKGDETHRWTFYNEPAVYYREEHSKKCSWKITSTEVTVTTELAVDHVEYLVTSKDTAIDPVGSNNDIICSAWISTQRAQMGSGRKHEMRFKHMFKDATDAQPGDEWLEQGSLKLRRQAP